MVSVRQTGSGLLPEPTATSLLIPPLSPRPTGEDVMASFLKWHPISSHWGSRPVCCSHSQDRSYLKYSVISLAPWRLWHARHKYCIGGEVKIMLSPKHLSSKECMLLCDTNPHHMCLCLSERLVCFTSDSSDQSGSCSSAQRRKSIPKLLGQCFLYFQQISRKLPHCRHSGHNAQRSGVKQTCVCLYAVWPDVNPVWLIHTKPAPCQTWCSYSTWTWCSTARMEGFRGLGHKHTTDIQNLQQRHL